MESKRPGWKITTPQCTKYELMSKLSNLSKPQGMHSQHGKQSQYYWKECTERMSQKLAGCCPACSNYYDQNRVVNSYLLSSLMKSFTYFFLIWSLPNVYVVDIFGIAILHILQNFFKLTDNEIIKVPQTRVLTQVFLF